MAVDRPLICACCSWLMTKPAGSSAPLLIRKPDDKRCSDVFSALFALFKLFCATRDPRLLTRDSIPCSFSCVGGCSAHRITRHVSVVVLSYRASHVKLAGEKYMCAISRRGRIGQIDAMRAIGTIGRSVRGGAGDRLAA